MTIAIGDSLPTVALTMMDGRRQMLPERQGRALLLYFYPRDDTSGCTREALEFSALADKFGLLDVDVLGVSKDSPAKHARFVEKHGLTVPLATDEDQSALDAFGAWVEKSLYGRRYMGIDRSTFLFDADGKLVRAWRKVKVPGHAEQVLAAAREMQLAGSR